MLIKVQSGNKPYEIVVNLKDLLYDLDCAIAHAMRMNQEVVDKIIYVSEYEYYALKMYLLAYYEEKANRCGLTFELNANLGKDKEDTKDGSTMLYKGYEVKIK